MMYLIPYNINRQKAIQEIKSVYPDTDIREIDSPTFPPKSLKVVQEKQEDMIYFPSQEDIKMDEFIERGILNGALQTLESQKHWEKRRRKRDGRRLGIFEYPYRMVMTNAEKVWDPKGKKKASLKQALEYCSKLFGEYHPELLEGNLGHSHLQQYIQENNKIKFIDIQLDFAYFVRIYFDTTQDPIRIQPTLFRGETLHSLACFQDQHS